MGNVGGMVAWLVRVACLHEWCASVSGVGGVLAWVPCYRWLHVIIVVIIIIIEILP